MELDGSSIFHRFVFVYAMVAEWAIGAVVAGGGLVVLVGSVAVLGFVLVRRLLRRMKRSV